MLPKRHDWVYLRDGARPAFAPADDEARRFAADWLADARPLVVTRQHAQDGTLALGLCLPATHETRRLACTVSPADVLRHRNPLTVEEAAAVLPDVDASALRRFASTIAGHALQVGVYGSTAWEHFAGGGHRHAHSDIDVICDVASSAGLTACLAAFADGTRYFRSRLDGEIRFIGGRAVAWRELFEACTGGPAMVLAKGERDIALLTLHCALAPLR